MIQYIRKIIKNQTVKRRILLLVCLVAVAFVRADNGRLYTSADRLSSSMIGCIAQDHYGYIWIGTEHGLNKFDGYRFTNYFCDPVDSATVPDNDVTAFLTDREQRLWVGTRLGLARYVYEDNAFKHYVFPGHVRPRVESLMQNGDGDVVIGTAGHGIFVVRKGSERVERLSDFTRKTSDEYASRIFEDAQGAFWRCTPQSVVTRVRVNNLKATSFKDFQLACGPAIGCIPEDRRSFLLVCTYGILRYDYASGRLEDAGFDLSALDRRVSIRKALIDHDGCLYVGTSGRGVMVIPRGSRKLIALADAGTKGFELATANVNDIFEDKDHNLWVSCYKKGLFLLNQSRQSFSTWAFSAQNYRLGSSVSSIASGSEGDVWCTVQKSGVYRFNREGKVISKQSSPDGANTIYRDRTGRFWLGTENALYSYNPDAGTAQLAFNLDGWGVNCMVDDGDGTLFVSNFGKGLAIYNIGTRAIKAYSMYQRDAKRGYLCNDWIKSMCVDSRGLLWIGCSDGLSCLNPADGNFRIFGWNNLLEGFQCFSICEQKDGNMLIGTNAGLYLFDRKRNKLALFPGSEEVRNKSIYGITIDHQGDIWLSTVNGIWQFDAKKRHFIGHINGNGLEKSEYISGAVLHSADDRVVFGTNDGVVAFYPSAVRGSGEPLGEVFLSSFVINGKAVNPLRDRFSIPYDDNSFMMEFSLFNYRNAENITFQYRINDANEWISVPEGTNAISFNKMKPGKYVIEVRAMNNGVYSKSTRKITVRVKDPWYSSPVAYAVYTLLALGLLLLAFVLYDRRRRNELEEAKMRFLINATHDIRSPLTLILGPLKKLKSRVNDAESLNDIDTIDRNAQRLLQLVNQILDERKIDKNQMRLHCRETDLVRFINGVCTLYQYNARQRSISFGFEHAEEALMAWIDRTQFDKVLTNLLSNAFKYTHDGGEITFHLSHDEHNAVIRLVDSGIGFKDEKTDRLFERFAQGRNAEDFHIEGTGIGLNLARAIVNLHGGKIRAYNRTDGRQGACLEVSIPLGNAHLKPDEIEENDANLPAFEEGKKAQASRNFRIMVVDDDPEIAHYIESELSNWYRFGLFQNGKEALKALLTEPYDLVISDVIMPEMDGVTLLKKIKGNTNISDIPVILLTTKTEVNDRLLGLKHGADAYVAKPFNMEELHILIDKLIDNVRRLRGKFSGAQTQEEKVEKVEVKGNNDALMERIMRSVNEHLGDPDFNVERLTADVGISRAQLHRKMKEMTGISTGDFIRNLRLEQAARLIKENKINVTQVAYSVGFNNQSHFSTVFRKHFGVSPSEYAAKFGKKE